MYNVLNGIPRTRVRVPVEMHVFHISSIILFCRIIKPEESLFNGLTDGIKHATVTLYCRCSHECNNPSNTSCSVSEANCTYDQFLHKCRQHGKDVNEKIRER